MSEEVKEKQLIELLEQSNELQKETIRYLNGLQESLSLLLVVGYRVHPAYIKDSNLTEIYAELIRSDNEQGYSDLNLLDREKSIDSDLRTLNQLRKQDQKDYSQQE